MSTTMTHLERKVMTNTNTAPEAARKAVSDIDQGIANTRLRGLACAEKVSASRAEIERAKSTLTERINDAQAELNKACQQHAPEDEITALRLIAFRLRNVNMPTLEKAEAELATCADAMAEKSAWQSIATLTSQRHHALLALRRAEILEVLARESLLEKAKELASLETLCGVAASNLLAVA